MANLANEKVKRRYFSWLMRARGYSEKTVVSIERAIHQFEEFTGYKDFKTFCERQATGFKKWLDDRKTKGKPLSNTTKYHTLRHLKAFFSWLASQPGYKSRISLDAVSYLALDRRTVREVLSPRPHRFPSLEQVKRLVDSIRGDSEIDRRDRALISFLLLTGIRYRAVCSLSLSCFDPDLLVVYQDPRRGVHTKGGKAITTWVLRFDDDLVKAVTDWVRYLSIERKFGPSDPLFPRTQIKQSDNGFSFEACGVEPVFWSGGNSIRDILKSRAHAAGLPYFPPHSFRHAACQLALRMSRSPEELKALSQNFGHEQVTTTLRSYGTLDQIRVEDIISRMNFSPDALDSADNVPIEDLMAFLRSKKNT
jgi:integrase